MSVSIPSELREAFARWDRAGRPSAEPSPWRRTFWEARVAVPEKLSSVPIDREVATEWARRVTAGDRVSQAQAFVVAMIWGHGPVPYGPYRTQRIMEQSQFSDHLAEVTEATLYRGGIAGYRTVYEHRWLGEHRDPGYLKWLGPAFGTKYLYFLTRAHRPGEITPVLDDVVRRWFRAYVPQINVEIGDWEHPDRYQAFVETVQEWGAELGIPSDEVEHLIFADQQTVDDGLWAEDWLPASKISASQLLDQLQDRIDTAGFHDEGADLISRLRDILC